MITSKEGTKREAASMLGLLLLYDLHLLNPSFFLLFQLVLNLFNLLDVSSVGCSHCAAASAALRLVSVA